MPETLKVVSKTGTGKLVLVEHGIPALKPGAVLVEVKNSLVSPGTELRGGWRALSAEKNDPKPLDKPSGFGYSNAGIVAEVGEGVTRFAPGDRVAVVGAGYARHATYAVAPHNLVFKLPDNLSFEHASFAMLAATALQALRRGAPEFGETIISAGMGLVGQLSAQLYELAGCYAVGWDLIQQRLDIAKECGISETCIVGSDVDVVEKTRAFTDGYGADGAVVSIPGDGTRAIVDIEKSLKKSPDGHPMGVITIVGGTNMHYKASLTNVDYRRASRTGPGYHDEAWEYGPDYPPVFMRWTTRTNVELCLRLISERKLKVDPLITHTLKLEDCESGIDKLIETPDDILGLIFSMD